MEKEIIGAEAIARQEHERALGELARNLTYISDPNGFRPRSFYLELSIAFSEVARTSLNLGLYDGAIDTVKASIHNFDKVAEYLDNPGEDRSPLFEPNFDGTVTRAEVLSAGERCARVLTQMAQNLCHVGEHGYQQYSVFSAIGKVTGAKKARLNPETENKLVPLWVQAAENILGAKEEPQTLRAVVSSLDYKVQYLPKDHPFKYAAQDLLNKIGPKKLTKTRKNLNRSRTIEII